MNRPLHAGGVLAVDFLHQVVHVDDAVREFRLRRLPYAAAQGDYLLVVGHQLAIAADVLIELNLLQVVVEQEHVARGLRRIALQLYLRLVVLPRVEGTDVPRHPRADHAVERPPVTHHVVKHIVARVAVVTLGEEAYLRLQGGVERLFLRIGKPQLCIDGPEFGMHPLFRQGGRAGRGLRGRRHLNAAKRR